MLGIVRRIAGLCVIGAVGSAVRPLLRQSVVCGALLAASGCSTQAPVKPLPADPAFAAGVPVGHTRFSNTSLSELFTDLVFDTEWGETIPRLLRLDAPVSVHLTGPSSADYAQFVDGLLSQIAREAGVEISRGAPPHNLVVRFVPGREWAPLSGNQCIIVFGTPTWASFLQDRQRYSDWQAVAPIELASRTVFIPDTNEPHEIRECLIEEIAQALGPTNDIYGLGPSIFNDDDAHVWPTRLDYLMLRVLYDPRMRSGIGRADARARALEILNRINPKGHRAPSLPPHRQREFLRWRKQLHDLYDLISKGRARTPSARAIVTAILREARTKAPFTAYHCEALSVAATLETDDKSPAALGAVDQAERVCETVHGPSDIRAAGLQLSRGIALLGQRRDRDALQAIEGLDRTFLAYGQDAMLAIAYAARWTALYNLGDPEAERAKELALAWTIYAFGEDHDAIQRWKTL